MLRSVAKQRVSKHGIVSILRDGASRLLRMRAEWGYALDYQLSRILTKEGVAGR
jgi:hypothetical protein